MLEELRAICARYIHLCQSYLSTEEARPEELIQAAKYFASSCTSPDVASILIEHRILETSLECVSRYSQSRLMTPEIRVLDKFALYIAFLSSNFVSCGELFLEHLYLHHLHHMEHTLIVVKDHPTGVQACIALLCCCLRYAGSSQSFHPLIQSKYYTVIRVHNCNFVLR